LLLISNEDKRAAMVGKGIGGVLGTFSGRARHSITFDRGTEFMGFFPVVVPR
jgi:IS30 family transposase